MSPPDHADGAAAAPVLDREGILALVPHQGTMCLLDAVRAFDGERVHATTACHRRADMPLRREGGDGAGELAAVHLCEIGAQAMAVHGGLLARAHGGIARPGLLVSLRGVAFHAARIDDLPGELDVHAERLLDAGDSWQYQFRIEHAGAVLAEGRAAVMLRPDTDTPTDTTAGAQPA